MKNFRTLLFLFSVLLFCDTAMAQYGYGNGYGYGRRRNPIPQAQTQPKEPEPMTAEEVVDGQMPKITEAIELNSFEEAVVRSILVKYVQKSMELQILKLPPEKMKEEYEKISKLQEEELKAGLPEDKFNAFMELRKNRFQAKKKKKKKKKKNKD